MFPLYLLTLKISCVQLKRLKSLNFVGPCSEETPILELSIFVNLFRKFDPSRCNGLKVEILMALLEGDPQFGTPKFRQILSFVHICLP